MLSPVPVSPSSGIRRTIEALDVAGLLGITQVAICVLFIALAESAPAALYLLGAAVPVAGAVVIWRLEHPLSFDRLAEIAHAARRPADGAGALAGR